MPFDGHEPLAKLTAWRFGNDKLAELEWLLRQPMEQLQHQWNFEFCGGKRGCGSAGCALGLGVAMGVISTIGTSADDELGISREIGSALFVGANRTYHCKMADVTPLMVADAIRKYMLTGEV